MRLLVLGGTAWLGHQVTAIALERGHAVTCLARGDSGTVPEEASFVRADRDDADALSALGQGNWDAAIDVARQPGHVRRATAFLRTRCAHYVFVSSCSVYADHSKPGTDEGADLLPALDVDVMDSMESYGNAKVACEEIVRGAFGSARSLVARAGLIGGAGDVSGRTGYWPRRFARPSNDDGRVLVPDTSDFQTQVIDVRDLAAWLVSAAEHQLAGVYNATGETVAFGEHVRLARTIAGHTGPVVTVGSQWLLDHDVQPWMGERSLPLWLPMPAYAGFGARDSSAARKAGLTTRPLSTTLSDVLAWELDRPVEQPGELDASPGADRSRGVGPSRGAGLTDAEERDLLDQLASRID